jgi:hypothetical protein
MAELVLGGLAVGSFLSVVQWSRTRRLRVSWWQWALTLLAFFYALFVAEVVIEFLREGTPKGALVMGTIMGFFAVVWAVLLKRFVFVSRRRAAV